MNTVKYSTIAQTSPFNCLILYHCLLSILINRQFKKVNYNFPQQIFESKLHGQTKHFIELTAKRFNPFSINNIPSNLLKQKQRENLIINNAINHCAAFRLLTWPASVLKSAAIFFHLLFPLQISLLLFLALFGKFLKCLPSWSNWHAWRK